MESSWSSQYSDHLSMIVLSIGHYRKTCNFSSMIYLIENEWFSFSIVMLVSWWVDNKVID